MSETTATAPNGNEINEAQASDASASAAESRRASRAELPGGARIAIIGSGFSGLAMAIRLKQEGHTDFVVLERGADVGGTWRDNTYPGCRCDVPSHLYSLSFAPNPDWSESFSRQGEIWEYLRSLVDRFGLRDHIYTECEVADAAWDEGANRWRLVTSRGAIGAELLLSAIGGLVDPKIPPIPGLEGFDGEVFHSARWDHDHDLRGERVAVIGTGASAIQFVPQIQPDVAELHLFQRTPPWIAPRVNRPISSVERRLFRRFPALQGLARAGIYWSRELVARGLIGDRRVLGLIRRTAERHLRAQVADPELRAKLTPDYEIGCKRILISNDYYPALAEDNVELIAGGVAEVRGNTVVATDGSEAEVDTIVFGTGFHVTDTPAAQIIRGADGRTLREVWGDSMFAHRGTAIAGFPNLFMIFGPHAGIGHTSATVMIEAQVGYVIDALAKLDAADVGRFEVRGAAQRAFLDEIDRRMEGTVWTSGGCESWYLDASGRNTTLWPTYTFRYAREMASFRPEEFELTARGELPAAALEAGRAIAATDSLAVVAG